MTDAAEWARLLSALLDGKDLRVAEATWAMERVMAGEASAATLAGFLVALRGQDATGGPAPGPHSFLRGASPGVYGEEVERALENLAGEVPADPLRRLWDEALGSRWDRDPVWVHGDV
ncbi:MAG: hypothetical protein ACTHJL_14070, partial [Amnibacterium sp.]